MHHPVCAADFRVIELLMAAGSKRLSGVAQIAEAPRVLAALNPAHAVGIFIAGKGQLLDVDLPHLRQQLEASRDYVFAAARIEQDLFRSN